MSAGLRYDLTAIELINQRIARLSDLDRRGLLATIGATVESQTRRRIAVDKSAPDGTAWPAWSAGQAATRHGGQSLLQGEGDLLDSITHELGRDRVEVGTNLVYGAIHQVGGQAGRGRAVSIPARPYLGLSDDDAADLGAVVADFFREALA